MHAMSRKTLELTREFCFKVKAAAVLDGLLAAKGWSPTEKAVLTELHKRIRKEQWEADERLYKQIKAFDDFASERQQQNEEGQK